MNAATPVRTHPRHSLLRWLLGAAAILFGTATLVEGGQVLFGSAQARAEAGHVVPFVLMFNFGAGFAYILSGLATLAGRAWTVWVARGLAIGTLTVFAAFGVHVLTGGAYETRTLLAIIIRSGFWIAQALLLPRVLQRGHHG